MTLSYGNETFSDYEAQLAFALKLYTKPSDLYALSDETIGHVLGFTRGGVGVRPILCQALLSTLPRSSHVHHRALYEAVVTNRAHWQARARDAYRLWMEGCSKMVQKYVTILPLCYPRTTPFAFYMLTQHSGSTTREQLARI